MSFVFMYSSLLKDKHIRTSTLLQHLRSLWTYMRTSFYCTYMRTLFKVSEQIAWLHVQITFLYDVCTYKKLLVCVHIMCTYLRFCVWHRPVQSMCAILCMQIKSYVIFLYVYMTIIVHVHDDCMHVHLVHVHVVYIVCVHLVRVYDVVHVQYILLYITSCSCTMCMYMMLCMYTNSTCTSCACSSWTCTFLCMYILQCMYILLCMYIFSCACSSWTCRCLCVYMLC